MQFSHVSSGGSLVDMALTLWGRRNRLHTHAGARWSVVFYAAANVGQSGSLLLVPKHSQSATDHELTLEERAFRANRCELRGTVDIFQLPAVD